MTKRDLQNIFLDIGLIVVEEDTYMSGTSSGWAQFGAKRAKRSLL